MKRAYVYKLRPTKEQETVLLQTLETCRHLYNHALAERKHAWETEQRSVILAEQNAALPALKKLRMLSLFGCIARSCRMFCTASSAPSRISFAVLKQERSPVILVSRERAG